MNTKNKPIRVLEVFGRMDRGGAEAMIMNLYRKMDRDKVQMDFMVHTNDHCQYDDEIEQLGGRIYHIPRFKGINFFNYRKQWRRFYKEHPELHVIHGHMGATAAIYLHEANLADRYTIAHSHSAGKFQTINDLIYYFFSWPTRFIARHLFGCSTEAGIARYGKKAVKSSRYSNFTNAIDLQKFTFNKTIRNQKRKELGINDNQLLVINVGRITTPKNPSMTFRIFKEIVLKDKNIVCIWVGTGEQELEYKEKIISEKLQDNIIMTGLRTDIPDLLMAADVFLFPSLWEGLPLSVIEAQATGLPCVISNTISKEVEVSSLIEWHSLSDSLEIWATRCIFLANKYVKNRHSPIDELKSAGYDINESVQKITDIYLKSSME